MQKKSKKINIDLRSLRFTPEHEWVYLEGNTVVIGVTEIVTARLGSALYLDLPVEGDEVLTIVPFGEIESIDDTFDINSPVEGETIAINENLMNRLDVLSSDPYKKGWLIQIYTEDPTPIESLMTGKEYEERYSVQLNQRKKIPKRAANRKKVATKRGGIKKTGR